MLSTSDVFTVAFISFQLDVSFCSHDYTFGVGSVGVDGAWFVGASRWYRVSFPFTGPSYLSNTLCSVAETDQLGSMGYMYGYYQSWVSHVGNRRCDHRATETDLVVLLFVRIFVGGRILSMKQMALARSFIRPERQLHIANSPN